jgi:excisionase family DNA binding protein
MRHFIPCGYLTPGGARRYTSLSPQTLAHAVEYGELRAYKVGHQILYARRDLDEFIRQTPVAADVEKIVDKIVAEVGGL